VLIRHADPACDALVCSEIYKPSVLDSPTSFEEDAPDAQQMARRIETYSQTHPWLVAEDNDVNVIGFAYACQHRERAAYRWAADVSAYVDEAHRREGVGRSLYHALFELLIRQGLQVACAGITLPNDPSVALHESLGFQPVGVYRRIGWKAGAWREVGWWELELVEAEDEVPADPGPPLRLDD
jgi:L-amino acid N-acyltransferase YncA